MQKNKACGLVIGIEFTDTLSLDMSTVVPTISGPKRPQDKVLLTDASTGFKKVLEDATRKKRKTCFKSFWNRL